MGIKGHTCCFRKLSHDIVNTLPRSEIDLICVIKEIKGKQGLDDIEKQYYNVRRSKVINALKWLKEYHRGYSDITIDEDALSWMKSNEQNIPDDRLRHVRRMVSNTIKTQFFNVSKKGVSQYHY
jgi:hypothetical protein